MAVTAASIVKSAQEILSDLAGVRWPAGELVRYLNEAQGEIARVRPDQKTITRNEALIAGAGQTIPADAQALIDIQGNAAGRKRAIRKIDQIQLEAVQRDWQSRAPGPEILHYMHDIRDPRTFYVYPPASEGQLVNVVLSLYPADVPDPVGSNTYNGVAGSIDLPDHWKTSILNYMLYRAYAKDAEYGGNAQMAAQYLALFDKDTGAQLASTAAVAPKT
jgi:hypothetical protein